MADKYKNPIPSVDDEYETTIFGLSFIFEEAVTIEEAAERINCLIAENGGKINAEWLHMGKDRRLRYALPQR